MSLDQMFDVQQSTPRSNGPGTAHSPKDEPAPAPEGDSSGSSRRDFLKPAGFALTGTVLGGCQPAPVQYVMAPVVQPEAVIPGRAYDYASTCGGCTAGCGVLAKVRDGRPIKLEGNPQHPLSQGGLCAAGQASLLGLYDRQRLRHPLAAGKPAEWDAVDQAIHAQLDDIRKRGRPVRFLTGSLTSPTTQALIGQFLKGFPDARHVVHDPRPGTAILAAHARTHGLRLLPRYHFEKARVIVSFDADFLGRWISPVEFAAAYQAGRRLDGHEPEPSYHVQIEARLSLTGSKADQRLIVAPGEVGLVMSHLATRVAKRAGAALPALQLEKPSITDSVLDQLADHLWHSRKRSLVVCDSQDVEQQVLCNYMNHVLDNYGSTVDVEQPSYQQQGDDSDMETLIHEVLEKQVAALFIFQSNPVHDLPAGEALGDALRRVPLLVSCAERLDETAQLAQYVCPIPHYLESWSDAEAVSGLVSVVQPAIAPLANTRPVLESLTVWMGSKPQPARDLLRASWEKDVFPRWQGGGKFQDFWDKTIHDGLAEVAPRKTDVQPFDQKAVQLVSRASRPSAGTYTLVLYSKVGLPDASHAYNPWLHELPDPVSKVTWDNYACLSPATAKQLGLGDGDVVRLEAGDAGAHPPLLELPLLELPVLELPVLELPVLELPVLELPGLELPVLVQRGQHDQVVAVALGYGSRLSERFAKIGPEWLQARSTVGTDGRVGKNAAGLLTWVAGSLRCVRDGIRLTKTGPSQPLAMTQSYDLLDVPAHLALPGQERRPIIRETTVSALRKDLAETAKPDAAAGSNAPGSNAPGSNESGSNESGPAELREDLWPADHPTTGQKWGMAIDLNACNGCSACVVACQVENNIPVVGKDEVRRHREMYWMRIDRYYTELEEGAVNVAHQPMLCQHCGNAPCETVCPVLATVHSEDGLNEQVYNRCVGTRYCANNCPYKVRRFNWFDYAHDDILQNLVLNPDVTVRSRGVMEKCTFCVQRIEDARGEAGGRGQPIRDGAIQTACQQSCPAQAIVFGDLNDPASRVAQLTKGPRSYRVLEELNVKPSVSYLAIVRNRPENGKDHEHG